MDEKRFGGLIVNWEDYVALFRKAVDEIAIGEATPLYLWSGTAARNIPARFPRARIIINLRNPVDRAYSHYLHMLSAGVVRRSFREQIDANLRCRDKRFGGEWPFLELGHYYEQITRYLGEFPSSQIHISLHDDLQRNPDSMLASLYAFLGVDREFRAETSVRHNEPRVMRAPALVHSLNKRRVWLAMRHLLPAPVRTRLSSLMVRPHDSLVMPPADRAFLADYYREGIGKLGALLSRDLSSWLQCGTLGHSRGARDAKAR
jgi:Sulfotransferase family